MLTCTVRIACSMQAVFDVRDTLQHCVVAMCGDGCDSRVCPMQVSDVTPDDRSTPSDKHTQKIAAHVSAYIHHVRTQLKQTIPKAIVHCLVRPQTLVVLVPPSSALY